MASYNTPGVYVEEIPSLPATISAVDTAIPVFIGYTAYATSDPLNTAAGDLDGIPHRIQSMKEYTDHFGGPQEAYSLAVPGGAITSSSPIHYLYYCIEMYFANGGGPCYIQSVGGYGSILEADLSGAYAELKKYTEPTLVVVPEMATLGTSDYKSAVESALTHCQEMGDRFAILDTREADTDPVDAKTHFRAASFSQDEASFGACYYPHLKTTLRYPYSAIGVTGGTGYSTLDAGLAVAESNAAEATKLHPHLPAVNATIASDTIILPPSAAMAGLYARVDRNRGVWKAPANEPVKKVDAPVAVITDSDQADFNQDSTAGKSINVIRKFTGRGNIVWGARTLDGNSNEWRYISVRRLFLMVEESIQQALESVVFEPNDQGTWVRVKAMIENFLTNVWRDGGLAGATPKDAFFVKVGLNETMNAQDIIDGKLIVQIGMAATRPAEFIILRFSHLLQTS